MEIKSKEALESVMESLGFFIENNKFPDYTCAADLYTIISEVIREENSAR